MPFKKGESGNPQKKFTPDNQPANRGRKGKSVTEYLRDIGDSKSIKFTITMTKQDGTTVKKTGAVKSPVQMNQLLATLLYSDALKGNDKARKEVLDRMEGKPQQFIDMSGGIDVNDNRIDISQLSDTALAELEQAYLKNGNNNQE